MAESKVKIVGGQKMEEYLKALSKKVSTKATLQVGFLSGPAYPNGMPVAAVAAMNEYGTRTAPPRPFFRNAIAKNKEKWGPNLATLLVQSNYNAAGSLAILGDEIVGEVQESINELFSPPLSAITVMLRGMRAKNPALVVTGKTVGEAASRVAAGKTNYGASTKPLIDHGDMLRAVDKQVK